MLTESEPGAKTRLGPVLPDKSPAWPGSLVCASMPDFDDLPCLLPARKGSGCQLRVQVQPGASRSGVAGLHGGALRVRVAAPPIDGRANMELQQWLAGELELPRRAVTLAAGPLSRHKRVHLECPAVQVAAWLRLRLAAVDQARP